MLFAFLLLFLHMLPDNSDAKHLLVETKGENLAEGKSQAEMVTSEDEKMREKEWKAAQAKCPDCSKEAWHECRCSCKAFEELVPDYNPSEWGPKEKLSYYFSLVCKYEQCDTKQCDELYWKETRRNGGMETFETTVKAMTLHDIVFEDK